MALLHLELSIVKAPRRVVHVKLPECPADHLTLGVSTTVQSSGARIGPCILLVPRSTLESITVIHALVCQQTRPVCEPACRLTLQTVYVLIHHSYQGRDARPLPVCQPG
jgi:hypothetical protein